jgi:hypothetical protein
MSSKRAPLEQRRKKGLLSAQIGFDRPSLRLFYMSDKVSYRTRNHATIFWGLPYPAGLIQGGLIAWKTWLQQVNTSVSSNKQS